MSLIVRYVLECDCGIGQHVVESLDLSQSPGEVVEIDLTLFGDMVMRCAQCGSRVWVPAISDHLEEME